MTVNSEPNFTFGTPAPHNFKPGDKVWIKDGGGYDDPGTFKGPSQMPNSYYSVLVEREWDGTELMINAGELRPRSEGTSELLERPTTLEGVVGTLIGAASGLWTNLIGAGEFRSTEALDLTNLAVRRLEEIFAQRTGPDVQQLQNKLADGVPPSSGISGFTVEEEIGARSPGWFKSTCDACGAESTGTEPVLEEWSLDHLHHCTEA